jgi:cell fate regulator YaaT (PSP1 superfamily)
MQANTAEQIEKPEEGHKKKEFKEGEILTLIRVRFPGNLKAHSFLVGKRKISYGQKVLAMSDRGMCIGYVNSFPFERPFHESMLPLRTVAKVADQNDIDEQEKHSQSEKKATVICRELVEKMGLDMTVTHVEYIQFGQKAVFYFNAPTRIDFRELVKALVSELKMRVELRQISVRDRASAIGGMGPCGLQTCCSYFLKNYGKVSIKMVKNQNLALIPSKINGSCGQIKCCMKYENEVYTEKRSALPKEGNFIKTANGDIGKVLKLHLLKEEFEMLTDQGQIRRYSSNQYSGKEDSLPPTGWIFPTDFESIVDETNSLVEKEKPSTIEEFPSDNGSPPHA